jgi:hypothetical protein
MPSRSRLGEALARLWTSLWSRRGPLGVKTEHEESGGRWPDARSRFWSEFREGQREAEARSARPR